MISERLPGQALLRCPGWLLFFLTLGCCSLLPRRLQEAVVGREPGGGAGGLEQPPAVWSWGCYFTFLRFGSRSEMNELSVSPPWAPGIRKLHLLIRWPPQLPNRGWLSLPSVWGACLWPFPSFPSSLLGKNPWIFFLLFLSAPSSPDVAHLGHGHPNIFTVLNNSWATTLFVHLTSGLEQSAPYLKQDQVIQVNQDQILAQLSALFLDAWPVWVSVSSSVKWGWS